MVITANIVLVVGGTPSAPAPVTVYDADWLCFTASDNPGSWSAPNNSSGTSGVAVGITNIDAGIPQRVTVSLSRAVATDQTLTMTINNQVISAAFSSDNNTTINHLCSAYTTAFPGASASRIPSGGTNDLQFVLVAPDSTTQLVITNQGATGTGTLPILSNTITLNNTPSNGSFNFVVYENKYFVSPDEIYNCTYNDSTNGVGRPTGLAYVINGIPGASAAASPRVKVVVNPLFSGKVNGPTNVTASANALGLPNQRWLRGGVDGSLPSTQQVVAGWQEFNNPESITIRLLINCGYTDPAVHQEMISIASHRMDCFAICDMPSDSQDVQDAVNFRNNIMNVNSYWGAIYSPDILIYDDKMGVRRYVPPSGIVAGQYAFNDRIGDVYTSPAGLTRGVIEQALGARFTYEEGDRDALSQAQINAIRKFGASWVIWDESTLQQEMSALQSVGVVRLMITIMTQAANVCAYSVFEPNNPYTWHKTTTVCNAVLNPYKQKGGVTDFVVQCNSNNNTPDIVDQRVMMIAMWIKPSLSALYLQLDGVVTRQSAIFTVEQAASNNMY